jgi:hypothetical protein
MLNKMEELIQKMKLDLYYIMITSSNLVESEITTRKWVTIKIYFNGLLNNVNSDYLYY